MSFIVKIASGDSFSLPPGEPILSGAKNSGITLPYSCNAGRCLSCKCRVVSGATQALHPELNLSEQEKSDGWILTCVRSAISDIELDVESLSCGIFPDSKTFPCKIDKMEVVAPDILKVQLRLPSSANFNFIPGQYVDVIGPSGVRRSYSFASADFVSRQVELHIRNVKGGVMSDYWFRKAKIGDLLRIHGPLGTFSLRDIQDVDLLFLATGTGIAPVKSMVDSVLSNIERLPKSITVLWGNRAQCDFYMDMSRASDLYRYVPVLSQFDDSWSGERGYVQDVAMRLLHDVQNVCVYACGSPAMINSAKHQLMDSGLAPKRFFSDAFVCSAN
ncbi:FAD-binding oxidoreductase [Vogesella sp. XCS3]|uniref:FAD-binding oxidoreductase n=1 Tax=Vogesella sp. XCS3 TaxID=2877939 RepID=UPI001D0BC895|nr:FAD-binding oxidoreductase [Vogesella sp. XCS3]UDM16694.1 2Fe-2S iron-sulfur cluster binding domain-containing protein [Vogesella sp. XCS3]